MQIQASRNRFVQLDTSHIEHPGLTLSRYLKTLGDDHEAAKMLLKQVAASQVCPAYQRAFQTWQETHRQRVTACITFLGALASPLAIGLGNESVTEVGLTTHWTYGMPVIPGAALKGLCRRGAGQWRQKQGLTDEAFRPIEKALFGNTTDASHFVFWDAWYDPSSVGGKPFHRDTITVHHPRYYGSNGASWPTDFDDPNPVPFLVIKPGAKFLFAIDAPSPEWGKFLTGLMQWSLAHLGIGAKTNAGYGRIVEAQVENRFQKKTGPTDKVIQVTPLPLAGKRTETWNSVTVTWDAGKGELTVRHEGHIARVMRPEATALFDALPESERERLRSQRRLESVDVVVEIDGNRNTIKQILHQGPL